MTRYISIQRMREPDAWSQIINVVCELLPHFVSAVNGMHRAMTNWHVRKAMFKRDKTAANVVLVGLAYWHPPFACELLLFIQP